MQAIILAAGMGKRLGEYTSENTKCMVKVLDETIIERMLQQLHEVGIQKIILVVGYEGEKLKNFVGENYKGIPITYVVNEDYQKTNNIYSLFLAKEYLACDDTILLESDLIFDTSILQQLLSHPSSNVVTVAKHESWMDGTVVTIDEANKILSFVPKKKFDYSKANEYFKTVNIYKFDKAFSNHHYIPFLEAYCTSMGENEYYEEVLRVIAYLEKSNLTALVIESNQKWCEIDDVQDLKIAETLFAKDKDKLNKYYERFGGYWNFPKVIDFCYLVNPYFPSEGLRNEMLAHFNTLLEQYPSGQEINRSIAAKVFGLKPSEILVGNGASEIINAYLSTENRVTGIILPTFEEYYNRLNKSLIKTFTPSNGDLSYNVQEIITFSEEVEQLLLINPDNPSGNFIPQADLIVLLKYLNSKNKTLVLDESFVDFTDEGNQNTLIHPEILREFKNLVVIKSISKSYGVPGIRLGIVASGNENELKKIATNLAVWNINSFGEFFMQIIDKYQNEYKEACKKLTNERVWLYDQLLTLKNITVIKSQSNYFLCKISTPYSATQTAIELINKWDILVKDCSKKLGIDNQEFIRIAIRQRKDNNNLITALKSVLA